MRKKKVMHILNTGSYSGAENVAVTIINNTKDFCDSAYIALNGSISSILMANRIEHSLYEQLSIGNIKKAIKKYKPDVIHAHDFTASVLTALAAPSSITVVSHLHNNPPWIKKVSIKTIVYGVCSKRYKTILTVSDSVMQEYIFGNLCKKSRTIGNPVDLEYIVNKVDDINVSVNSDILFLGRLTKQKNPLIFLDYVKELTNDIPGLKAAIVGDGELREKVETKIEKLGIDNNVTLYGFQDNPYNFIEKTRILCMPSLWEGFGLAAVEALAFGKPVIAANVGGLKKLITEECGAVCNTNEEFVVEMCQCLLNEDVYRKKRAGAYARAKELDNINKYVSIIRQVYNETK